MSWNHWLTNRCFKSRQSRFAMKRFSSRVSSAKLLLETLEDRLAPALMPISMAHPNMISDTAAGDVSNFSSSADGRYVVFSSEAANLVSGFVKNDSSGEEVFLYDRVEGQISLISHDFSDSSSSSNGNSTAPVISADGNYIAFISSASNLVEGQTAPGSGGGLLDGLLGGSTAVYLYNRTDPSNPTTRVVSHVPTSATTLANGSSGSLDSPLSITADGRYTVYVSTATNLVEGQSSSSGGGIFGGLLKTKNIFVYDSVLDNNTLISQVYDNATKTGDGHSTTATISADGSTIAYASFATNLIEDMAYNSNSNGGNQQAGTVANYFVYQRVNPELPYSQSAGHTELVTFKGGDSERNTASFSYTTNNLGTPALTPDGRYMAYVSTQSEIVVGQIDAAGQNLVFLYDVANTSNRLVSHASNNATASATGGAAASLESLINTPSISDDGRFVAYMNDANTIVSGFSGTGNNVYLYDRDANNPLTGTTGVNKLLSNSSSDATQGTGGLIPSVSFDGQYVAFLGSAHRQIDGLTNLNDFLGMDVLLYNNVSGEVSLVSHANDDATTTSNRSAQTLKFTGSGQEIVYLSESTNLVSSGKKDLNNELDLFVYTVESDNPDKVGTTETLSYRADDMPSLLANGYSLVPPIESVSEDGRYVVFISEAPNLIDGQDDLNFSPDVFLYDRVAKTTTLISHVPGSPLKSGNAVSNNPVISADGNYIAFVSFATDLMDGVTYDGVGSSLYLYNRISGELKLVSFAAGSPDVAANSASLFPTPSISANNGHVKIAYLSDADNLVENQQTSASGSDPINNVFLYDSQLNQNFLISHQFGSTNTTANNHSTSVTISDDGSTVAYHSSATNIASLNTGNDTNEVDDIFVYRNGVNTLATHAANNPTQTADTGDNLFSGLVAALPVSISANGNYLVFESTATNLVSGQQSSNSDTESPGVNVFLYDTLANSSVIVSHQVGSPNTTGNSTLNIYRSIGPERPVISADGNYVAYSNNARNLTDVELTNAGADNVYLYSRVAKTNLRISTESTSLPDSPSGMLPTISDDGRYVAFVDFAPPANAGLTDSYPSADIRLYDRVEGNLTLISHAFGDPSAVGGDISVSPMISGDGATIVFSSEATKLAEQDYNGWQDIYILAPDSPAPPEVQITDDTVTSFDPVNTVVGELTTTDPDNTYTFELVTGDDSFTITDSTLTTDIVFIVTTPTQVTITIELTDTTTGGKYQDDLIITIVPATPTDIELSNDIVYTLQPVPTIVGYLTTTDPYPDQEHTYTLITDTDKFYIEDDILYTNEVFDNTTIVTETIQIESTNLIGTSLTETFIITILPKPEIEITNDTITAFDPIGTTIGTLSIPDPDNVYTFDLVTGTDWFTITDDDLQTIVEFDNTSTLELVITIEATDLTTGVPFLDDLTIIVKPASPTDIILSNDTVKTWQPVGTLVGLLTTIDPYPDQTHTYTLITGLDHFYISEDGLYTNTIFENTTVLTETIQIQSTNLIGTSLTESFIITIEPAAPTDIDLSNDTITAYQPVSTVVGSFKTTDPDPNQTHSYTLLAGGDFFSIDGDKLITDVEFTNTTTTQYTITVQSTNTAGQSYQEDFVIIVEPASPTDIDLSNDTVLAWQPESTLVGMFKTTDPNPDQQHTYTLLSGGDSFQISGDELLTKIVFEHTTATTYTIEVQSTNTIGTSITESYVITVEPAPPTDIDLSNDTITAYQPVSTVVGSFKTTDPDPNQTHSYTLLAGGDFFSIDGDKLITDVEFTNTTTTQYTITVQSTNIAGQSYQEDFVIIVEPASPTDIDLSNDTVLAWQPESTLIGMFKTTDPNPDQQYTYTLLSGGDSFQISGDELLTKIVFEHTTATTYTIEVQSTNTIGTSITESFVITVEPAPPTDIDLSNDTITAYQPVSTVVGSFKTTDPDPNQTHSYTLLAGGDFFSIDGDKLVTDVEFTNTTTTQYTITVQSTNNAGQSYQEDFVIIVEPASPTDIDLSNDTVLAWQPESTLIGMFKTTDPNPDQQYTYELLSGGDYFQISGDELLTKIVFEHTTATTYTIEVQSTNTIGTSITESFVITVEPAPPTDIDLSNDTITAFQPASTVVGTFTTTDPDPNQTHSYTLLVGGDFFSIDGDKLVTSVEFTNTTTTQYTITVQSTNGAGQSYQEDFVIIVEPASPTDIDLSNDTITAFQPASTVVGTFTTTDPDPNQTHSYTLLAGGNFFSIDGDKLVTSVEFTNTTTTQYTITVQSTNTAGESYEEDFTITVDPAPPSDLELTDDNLFTFVDPGTVVGEFLVTDPNPDQEWTFTLITGDDHFEIDGNYLVTTDPYDFTVVTVVPIKVEVTNTIGASLIVELYITVNPSPPTGIELTDSTVVGVPNTYVGDFIAIDPNSNQTHSFTLVSGSSPNDNSWFYLDGNRLYTGSNFPNGSQSSYTILVETTNSLNLTYRESFEISVTNFVPSDILLSDTSVIGVASTLVGQLSTSDIDANQAYSYSLVSGLGSDDNAQFSIVGDLLYTAGSFQASKETYQIRVRSVDSGEANLFVEKTFDITISNFQPTDITLTDTSVIGIGSQNVGELATIDQDANQVYDYQLVAGAGDIDNSSFVISGNSLQTVPGFQATKDSYTIRVRSTDDGEGSLFVEKTFTISISNFNPTNITLSRDQVLASPDELVGLFATTDLDTDQTYTYELVAGLGDSYNDHFVIIGNQLFTGWNFPGDTDTYSIRVRSTDSGEGSLSVEKVFIISISDYIPTDLELSDTTVIGVSGTEVGTLTAIDEDSEAVYSYELVDSADFPDNFYFEIVGDTLVTANGFPDGNDSFSIRVRGTKTTNSSIYIEKTFVITVTNFVPNDITLSNSTSIGLSDQVVGALQTLDRDTNQTYTYELVAGIGDGGNGFFRIVNNELITNPNFPASSSVYSIRVRSTDSGEGNLFVEKTFSVSVSNFQPSDIVISDTSVPGLPNELVGILQTTDLDANQEYSYELVSGEGDTDNSLFVVDGNQLITGSDFSPDRDTYSIRLRSTDNGVGQLAIEKVITITISNFVPSDITLDNTGALGVPNSLVGTLSTVDNDFDQTYDYVLIDGIGSNDNGMFTIFGNQLFTSGSFPTNGQSSYLIRVQSTDSGEGNLTTEKNFVISVVSLPPTDIQLSNDVTNNTVAIGSVVGDLSADDPDIGETFTFVLLQGNAFFQIQNNQLLTNTVFTNTEDQSFPITIQVVDSTGLTFAKDFSITVEAIAVPPTETPGGDTATGGNSAEQAQFGGFAGAQFQSNDNNSSQTNGGGTTTTQNETNNDDELVGFVGGNTDVGFVSSTSSSSGSRRTVSFVPVFGTESDSDPIIPPNTGTSFGSEASGGETDNGSNGADGQGSGQGSTGEEQNGTSNNSQQNSNGNNSNANTGTSTGGSTESQTGASEVSSNGYSYFESLALTELASLAQDTNESSELSALAVTDMLFRDDESPEQSAWSLALLSAVPLTMNRISGIRNEKGSRRLRLHKPG